MCRRCGEVKKVQKFKSDKRQVDGRSVCCVECYTYNKLEKWTRSPEQIESQRNKLKGRKYSLEHRLALSNANKKRVADGIHPWKVNDEEHPNQDRSRLEYKIWKEKVKDLRGNKCKECSSTERLHCHHLLNFKDFPEKRFEPENGELLCIRCHTRHHRLATNNQQ